MKMCVELGFQNFTFYVFKKYYNVTQINVCFNITDELLIAFLLSSSTREEISVFYSTVHKHAKLKFCMWFPMGEKLGI
jgi:CRISPR/Cas system endoribonuclease Cas6 (RAMP superfamily)